MAPTTLNWINLAAFILNLIITFVVGTTHAVGKTNAEVSDAYPTLFTPAGYAFSIWGIIFAFEAAFSVYQMFPKVGESDLVQKGISYWWLLMNLFQYGWSFAFALESLPLSLALMLGIFFSLAAIVLNSRRYWVNTGISGKDYLLLVAPFSINFGWITAATFANINIVFVAESASNSVLVAVCIVSFILAAVATTYLGAILKPGDPFYALVIVWSTVAIAVKLASPPDTLSWAPFLVTDGLRRSVLFVAVWAALTAVVAFATLLLQASRKQSQGLRRGSDEGEADVNRVNLLG